MHNAFVLVDVRRNNNIIDGKTDDDANAMLPQRCFELNYTHHNVQMFHDVAKQNLNCKNPAVRFFVQLAMGTKRPKNISNSNRKRKKYFLGSC